MRAALIRTCVSHHPQLESVIRDSGEIGRMQFEEPTDSGRQH